MPLGPLTAGGLAALWAGGVEAAQVDRMVERLDGWAAAAPFGVPTCDPTAPAFDPERYWRGPAWVLVNWLVADGLARSGHPERAEQLRASTLALVERAGFSEYYDAIDGAGTRRSRVRGRLSLTLAWLIPYDHSSAADSITAHADPGGERSALHVEARLHGGGRPRVRPVVVAGDLPRHRADRRSRRAGSRVLEHLRTGLASRTKVAVCSGNHDLNARNDRDECAARWLESATAAGVVIDGARLETDDLLVTVCAFWDGPRSCAVVDAQLAEDAARVGDRTWLWVYHAPPDASPTSWTGKRHYGDEELSAWIDRHHPDVWVRHVHQSPSSRRRLVRSHRYHDGLQRRPPDRPHVHRDRHRPRHRAGSRSSSRGSAGG